MKLKTFLFFAAIILVIIIVSGKTALYYYWSALVMTVSYLNSRSSFLQERYKLFNALFLLYLAFVVWERTRHNSFSPFVELQINNLEHIFFGIMICTIANLVMQLPPFNIRSFYIRLLFSVLIFNSIGFINEWFQNRLYGRPVFTLIPDSVKDLRMNLLGTLIFVLMAVVSHQFNHHKWKVNVAI